MKLVPWGVAVLVLLASGCGKQLAASPAPAPTVSSTSPVQPTTTQPTEPDFPLLDGYPPDDDAEGPDDGRAGPNQSLEPMWFRACGDQVGPPEHAYTLRGEWTNPEDFRERLLANFGDVPSAQGYADEVVGLYRACPEEVSSPSTGERVVRSVTDGDLGEWSAAVIERYERQGYPAVGLSTIQLVRVGTAVLVATSYDEGGSRGEADEGPARRQSAAEISGVVDAMTRFSAGAEPPFGPDGFGQVTLGLGRAELLALPGVRITGDNGRCETFEGPAVGGWVQLGLGVAVISPVADLETPEGVHVGSAYDPVRAAYPEAVHDQPWVSVALPGERSYRFQLGRDRRVVSVMLLHDDQHCGG